MKRIIAVLLSVVMMALLLAGCGRAGDDSFVTGRFRIVETHDNFSSQETIFVDTETGVVYIWFRSGYGGGVTPLLDSEGNVQFLDER